MPPNMKLEACCRTWQADSTDTGGLVDISDWVTLEWQKVGQLVGRPPSLLASNWQVCILY